MPRWKNGAPKKLYVIVDKTGEIRTFTTLRKRKAWFADSSNYVLDAHYWIATYTQDGA